MEYLLLFCAVNIDDVVTPVGFIDTICSAYGVILPSIIISNSISELGEFFNLTIEFLVAPLKLLNKPPIIILPSGCNTIDSIDPLKRESV